MQGNLKPTLWRTARALANPDRLRLMRLVASAGNCKGVVELAGESGLPVPIASNYLRSLNARGLISVKRMGPFVFYGTASDRSLPVAVSLQQAFRKLFARNTLPQDWADRLLPILKAYSNVRREEMIRTVVKFQPIRYAELRRRLGICETSFLRHLAILTKAGVVARDSRGDYLAAKPANSLAVALLSAVQG